VSTFVADRAVMLSKTSSLVTNYYFSYFL